MIFKTLKDSIYDISIIGSTLTEIGNLRLDPTNVNGYVNALRGLSTQQAQLVLSTKGLSATQQQAILSQLNYANATGILTTAQMTSALVTETRNESDARALLLNAGLISSEASEATATNTVTAAKLKELVATGRLTQAEAQLLATKAGVTLANQKETSSFALLGAKLKTLGNSLLALGKAHPALSLLTLGATLFTGAVKLAEENNNKLIESQKKLIEEIDENISKYDDEISSLDSLQKKLQDAKGNKEALAQIQSELNQAIGDTPGLLNEESNAYNIANQKINDRIARLKELRKLELENKITAQKEIFNNTLVDNAMGIDHKFDYFANHKIVASDTLGSEFSGYLEGINANKFETLQSIFEALKKNGYGNGEKSNAEIWKELIDSYGGAMLDVEEIQNYFDNQTEYAQKIFSDYVNNAESIFSKEELNSIIEDLVESGYSQDLEGIENIITSLVENDELEKTINDYYESLYNDDIDSDALYQNIKGQFDTLIANYPELKGILENYFNSIGKDIETGINNVSQNPYEITVLSITDTTEKINSELKPAFDDLKSAYQTIFSLDDEGNRVFDLSEVDIDTLASIKTAIESMNEIDGVSITTETFEEFAKVLTDTSSTAEDVQEQFDNLVSAMLNQSNIVNLGSNVDILRQTLEQLGVTNIEEVLADIINAERELIEYGIELESVTNDQIEAFMDETNASDIAKQYLEAYVIQKTLANENALDTTEDLENLESLCKSLGTTGEMIEQVTHLKYLFSTLENSDHLPTSELAKIDQQVAATQNRIREIANEQYSADLLFEDKDFEYNFDGLKDEVDEFNKSATESGKSTAETIDWIETLISRIQRSITNLGKTVSATYKQWSTRNNALAKEMQLVNQEIGVQQKAYERYMAEANSIPLAENYKALVRSGAFDISTIADETIRDNVELYQQWYEKALDCADAIEDLRANLADLAMTKFDGISTQYDNLISQTNHYTSMLEGYVDQAETAGYMASEVYYEAMASKQEENIKQLQDKYSSLISAFDEAVKNGSIEKYSDDWNEMYLEICDVEQELQDATTQLIEFNQTLQQLSWDVFDRVQGYVSNIVTESEHLINILDGYDLHTDKGVITDEGLAVQGLHAVNYNTYMEQSIAYAEELARIEEEMANDPYDLELVDRRNELIELQQEAIANSIQEKEAIQSLYEDGYNKMLESLDKLISKRKEAMRSIKDLYDYEQSISEKTNTVASLNKQLESYKNDTSESGRALIQKITVERDKALKDLEQTEWEKQIEESEKLLDAFYSDTEEFVNTRLDNLDGLVAEAIDATNKNAETISSAIKDTANSYGYEISDQMETIWDSANNVVSVYGDIFHSDMLNVNSNIASAINGGTTNVITAIDGLGVSMKEMTAEINRLATINANSIASAQNAVVNGQANVNQSNNVPSVNTGNTGASNGGSNGTSDPTKETEKIYHVVDADTSFTHCKGTKSDCDSWISRNNYKVVKTVGTIIQVRANTTTTTGGGYNVYDKSNNNKLVAADVTLAQAQGMCRARDVFYYQRVKAVNAYASGTPSAKKGWAIVGEGEDGNEIILDKDGNALLTLAPQLYNFKGGEQVINGKETTELLTPNLMPLSAEQLWGNIVKTPSLPSTNSGVGGNINQNINLSFDLPNVTDANSLITELQNSKRFEKVIQSMTADVMVGKNSLGKFRF